ncbi:MAG TPA: hypothetical protein VHX17_06735 [Candidatus Cybelea sp.]|nr:hypothetical protein [Candidatus Cybelea sp.]
MHLVRVALASAVAAALLAACGGANPSSPAPGMPQVPALQKKLPKLLRIGHTPARPPRHTHAITAAMRQRAKAGGWSPLAAAAPFTNGAGTQIQMTDGTILVQDYCSPDWYPLIPDKSGSYVNGTWGPKTSMPSSYGPLYFASAILPDGKLIVQGGEYQFCKGAETNLGAIYDPVANTWAAVTAPSGWSEIGDGQSAVLANGIYMLGNCCGQTQALLDEGSLTWTIVGNGKADTNSEEGWTLLRNGQLLDADVFGEPNSELFNPKTSTWSGAGSLPQNLTQSFEIGPQTMMANNSVFVVGANQYTAIYNANTGKWSQGPNNPVIGSAQYDAADAPTSLLPNGEGMIPESPGVYATPAQFFLFNEKKFKQIANPPDAINDSSYNVRLLVLPTGQILEDDGSNDVEVYSVKGSNAPAAGAKPQITKVASSLTHGSTYKITGKRFNGISQANFYGDDDQQASNYPLVRITNAASGTVTYARTHGFSFMGIGSNKKVSAMFDVPSSIQTGASTVEVVTNGVASSPVSVTIQ